MILVQQKKLFAEKAFSKNCPLDKRVVQTHMLKYDANTHAAYCATQVCPLRVRHSLKFKDVINI